MKKLKRLLLFITVSLFTACGVETQKEIDPTRGFDMWEYMTSTLDYRVEYDVYENNQKIDYYIENNMIYDNGDTYERRSETGRTTLYLNSRIIVMKEPTRDVEIERYVHLGDSGIFRASSIDRCTTKRFYPHYKIKNSTFENVLMVECLSKSSVIQEFYYGYNEGIVAIYEREGEKTKEYVKVDEKRI
jgi:hypothetical protein